MHIYLYCSPVPEFIRLAQSDALAPMLDEEYRLKFDDVPGESLYNSWVNSYKELATLLEDKAFEDAYIFLEFKMPINSTHCDAILVGKGSDGSYSGVVIELKGWGFARESAVKDKVALRDKNYLHPSAQVRGYCNLLKYYHESFARDDMHIYGCSYLHNMREPRSVELVKSPSIFGTLPREYPVFTHGEAEPLENYLIDKVGRGEGAFVAQLLKEGATLPSPKLLDVLAEAVRGNFEWELSEDQQDVFDTIVSVVEEAKNSPHTSVVIVRGGPGTGKSVLAIQLLASAARSHWKIAHTTGSKAFITVMQALTQSFADDFLKGIHNVTRKNQLPVKELFTKSLDIAKIGSTGQQAFDLVVYDEAHRLWDFRRQIFQNFNRQLSDVPMIREVISASKVTAFFLDDNQAVRANEIGSVEHIRAHAEEMGAKVEVLDLNTQFRCSGSKSYIDWVDFVTGFSGNKSLAWKKYDAYDFQIVSSMQEMQSKLDRLHGGGNKCRVIAGFCWRWSKPLRNGALVNDIKDERFGEWSAPWIEKTGMDLAPAENQYYRWNTEASYYSQVGSIYSVQGFEFDYAGVVFGEDLIWRDGEWRSDLGKNKDATFKKELNRSNEDPTERLRNIYRVLLTRGMKGTYVFFLDEETRRHFEESLRSD